LFFLLHLIVSIIRRLFVVRRHLSSRSQIWTFPSSASEKIFSRYLKAGGKFSLERSLSTTKEEALMPTIENGQITKAEERRSLNEGDQTAEKADDVIKAARCFFSARRRRNIIWYTDSTKEERAESIVI
jgi:hypothetical protein